MRMLGMVFLFVVSVASGRSTSSPATPRGFEDSPALKKCMATGEAGHGVTAAIRDCLHEEIARQDEKLNVSYRAIMARLNAKQRRKLRSSERHWLAGLNADCEKMAYADVDGTASLILYDGCVLSMRQQRSAWLIARYKQPRSIN